jgi:ELWxxDGT repeat protein
MNTNPSRRAGRLDTFRLEYLETRCLPSITTSLLKDINVAALHGSFPGEFTQVGATTFFTADDGIHGMELWKTNGTAASTVLVRDIEPVGKAGSGPTQLTNVNGTLYFVARTQSDNHGAELWKSDGTSAGTVMVRDLKAQGGSYPDALFNMNGTLLFTANDGVRGYELWKSNGTSAGTVLVRDINVGSLGSEPSYFTELNGLVYFAAGSDGQGTELWRTNGTSAGTTLVRDINTGANGSYPVALTNVNGSLFFAAADAVHGSELWKSNGTSAGTAMIRDINPSSGAFAGIMLTNQTFPILNGTVFFRANDGVHGDELWKSNGTSAGTMLLRDTTPGTSGSFSFMTPYPVVVAGAVYFTPLNNPAVGTELWKSDGTSAGTVLVRDIRPGVNGSSPASLVNVNGRLFFSANDGAHGSELWSSNGTSAGTALVKEISPASSSYPGQLANIGGRLYFSADDGTRGTELWVAFVDNTAPTLSAAKSPTLGTIVKNSGVPVGAVGTLVSALVDIAGPLKNVVDADYQPKLGIALTAADTAHGTWYFSTNNGSTWLALGSVTPTSIRLLAADSATRIYFRPTSGYTGPIAAALTFRAWDRTTGVNAGLTTATAIGSGGGKSAFSTATDTVSLTVA